MILAEDGLAMEANANASVSSSWAPDPVTKDLVSLISLHIFVVTQLARKELLLTYLSPTDLSPSVAEAKPFSVCCCQCLVLLSTDLIFFVCVPIPFSASRGFSKCSWILTSWT